MTCKAQVSPWQRTDLATKQAFVFSKMSETDVDDQNGPASEEPEKEIQNEDDEEAKEKAIKHPSPVPEASIYARASMFNQSVSKKNGQLHRLFLSNRTDECLIIIEAGLIIKPGLNSINFSKFYKIILKPCANMLWFVKPGLPKTMETSKQQSIVSPLL